MFSKNVLVLEVILFPARWIFETPPPPPHLQNCLLRSFLRNQHQTNPDYTIPKTTLPTELYMGAGEGRGLENLAVSHRRLNTDSRLHYFPPGQQVMLTGY